MTCVSNTEKEAMFGLLLLIDPIDARIIEAKKGLVALATKPIPKSTWGTITTGGGGVVWEVSAASSDDEIGFE
jgi:hypothetical protein